MVTSARALVTGGAGFLGAHLCARLIEAGQEVLCVDNLFTSAKDNIVPLLANRRFEFLRHDITFPLYVEVDEIYNLACPAAPLHYRHDPVQTTKASVVGSINMLGLAKRLRAPILQASTGEVYGDPRIDPQTEEHSGSVNPIGLRACHDEGKRCAETLFLNYHRQHGLGVRIARIFSTYGPGMSAGDGRVISSFIVQALKGEPITIFGDGGQTRSFCYVDDMIDGLARLMGAPGGLIGPINLGHPRAIPIRALAEMILSLTGSASPIIHRPPPIEDPPRRCPDISLARATLAWEPKTDLEQGLKATIAYFDRLLKAPPARTAHRNSSASIPS